MKFRALISRISLAEKRFAPTSVSSHICTAIVGKSSNLEELPLFLASTLQILKTLTLSAGLGRFRVLFSLEFDLNPRALEAPQHYRRIENWDSDHGLRNIYESAGVRPAKEVWTRSTAVKHDKLHLVFL